MSGSLVCSFCINSSLSKCKIQKKKDLEHDSGGKYLLPLLITALNILQEAVPQSYSRLFSEASTVGAVSS